MSDLALKVAQRYAARVRIKKDDRGRYAEMAKILWDTQSKVRHLVEKMPEPPKDKSAWIGVRIESALEYLADAAEDAKKDRFYDAQRVLGSMGQNWGEIR